MKDSKTYNKLKDKIENNERVSASKLAVWTKNRFQYPIQMRDQRSSDEDDIEYLSPLEFREQSKSPLETAYKMQMLQGLGLMMLSLRIGSPTGSSKYMWMFRYPAASCFYVSSTLLPLMLIYRHFAGSYFAGDRSLELSKIGGLTSMMAWFFLALS